MVRRRVMIGLFSLFLAAIIIWLWPRKLTNVLLITLDTTRADRLGCYGYSRARTPALDQLAAEGVLCERAYTVAPLTLPAHASLFTGLYPQEHGLRTNGRGRLNQNLPTLATLLKQHGYDTGAFVASFVLDAKFGLDQGFDHYDDNFSGELPAHDALHRQRNASGVIDSALDWLQRPRSKPFFCWVHLYDPHAPYLEHRELFGEEFVDNPYDAEIAYVDQQITRLFQHLKSTNLERETLVVIVGDHGEGLGDHSELRHGQTLYNSTIHVPLIFRHPRRLTAGRKITPVVSLVDLAPPILDLIGLRETRRISGRSVLPVLVGQSLQTKPCLSATDEPFLENGWSPLRSLIDGDWKYVRTTRPELYELANDPTEKHNLVEAEPDQVQRMQGLIADFESQLELHTASEVKLTAAERRALSSLGYLGGESRIPNDPATQNLPDVKDMLPYEVLVEAADKMMHQGELEAAIQQYRDVIRDVPAHTSANWSLAQALSRQGKEDDALAVLRAFVALRPDSYQGRFGLGLSLLKQDLTAAIVELRTAYEIQPERPEAPFNLALALMDQAQFPEALKHLNAVINVDPQHSGAYRWRSYIRAQSGKLDEAIADCRSWVKYSPLSTDAHFQLGSMLTRRGATAEADRHLKRAADLEPENTELQFVLGSFFFNQRQFQRSEAHLKRCLAIRPDWPDAKQLLQRAQAAQNTLRLTP